MEAKRAAFFDVDNTIVRGSTIYFLGRGMYHRGYFTKADISRFMVANLRFRLTGKEKPEEFDRYKKAATDFIGGHKVEEVLHLGQEIYEEYVLPKLWKGAVEIANKHLAEGDEVWLVTATPEHMADIMAKNLGLTGAIGTKAEVKDGIFTGKVIGNLLHGKEKALAIQELAREKNFDLSKCYAYSDSHNDLPLLQAVGNPCAINPDALLRIRALKENWQIYEFRRLRWINRILGPLISKLAYLSTYLTPRRRPR